MKKLLSKVGVFLVGLVSLSAFLGVVAGLAYLIAKLCMWLSHLVPHLGLKALEAIMLTMFGAFCFLLLTGLVLVCCDVGRGVVNAVKVGRLAWRAIREGKTEIPLHP